MSNFSRKAVAVGLTVATVVWAAGATLSASAASLTEQQVQSILSMLQAFGADPATISNVQAALTGQPASTTTVSATQGSAASYTFTKDLTLGSKGADVKALQQFLNSKGYTVAKSGAGSPGNESEYFGPATKAALIKFQKDNNITPASGYFGPKTRAVVNSMGATTGTTTGTTTGGTTLPAGFNVLLASNNPVGGNFPAGASQVPMLNLTFTAGSQDLIVTAMNVYRGGLSSDNDINNVYLMDGSKVIATNLGLANGKATFSIPSGIFTVKAGTSKVITVAVDVSSNDTTSHTYTWSVSSSSDITANVSVNGTFPITSNTFTAVSVSNPALATVNVQNITTGGQVNAGVNNFLAGEISLQANNSAVQVKSIKLTENGTINAGSDLANIKLYNAGVQVGPTMPSLNPDGTVVFDLSSNPLQIASGQTVNLEIHADVVGGVNRYFKFTVQRSYDIVATDMTYNVGASVTGSFPVNGTQVNVSQGTLTVSKDAASPANYVVPGSTNQTLASFDFTAAGEAVRVTGLTYQITYNNVAANTVWNNLKLVDDQGVQIGSVHTSDNTVASSKTVTLTNLNYIIPAGHKAILSIKADVVSGYTGTLQASITGGSAQGYTSLATVTIPTQTGNLLSANAASFSAAVNNAVGSITTVSGASGVKIASFVLAAGPAEGVNVVSITLQTQTGVSGHFQNLMVKYGNTQLGYTQPTLTNSTSYTFSASTPINIQAGGTAVIDVYADTVSGATSSAAAVVALTGASATGVSSNSPKTLSGNPVGQSVTVNSAGTLTTSLAATPVTSQQVAMGATAIQLGNFQLQADNNEPINITNVTIVATSTSASDLQNIRLMNGSNQVGFTVNGLSAATGTVSFAIPTTGSGSLQVPQNGNVTLSVVADINGTNNAHSSDTVTVGLGAVQYSGALSSNSTSTANVVPSGATFSIYQGVLGVGNAIGSTGVPGLGTTDSHGTLIGAVTFSNTSPVNQNLTLSSTTVSVTVYNATSTLTTTTVTVYDAGLGKVAGTSTVTFGSNQVINLSNSSVTLSPGTTRTLYFYITPLTSAQKVNTNNPISANASMPEYYWSDGVTSGITHNPAITTMPAWSNITLVP